MRIIILITIILMLSGTNIYAQSNDGLHFYNVNNTKYPRILRQIIIKTNLLELDEIQESNVLYLKNFYLKILDEKTQEYSKNNLQISKIIKSRNRSLKQARKHVRENAQLYLQIGYTFIESLEYIKKNLGKANYDKLVHSSEIELFDSKEFNLDRLTIDENEVIEDFEQTGVEEGIEELYTPQE